jgi:hypothetical protein
MHKIQKTIRYKISKRNSQVQYIDIIYCLLIFNVNKKQRNFLTGHSRALENTKSDGTFGHAPPSLHISYMIFPLVSKGKLLGLHHVCRWIYLSIHASLNNPSVVIREARATDKLFLQPERGNFGLWFN